MKHSVNATKERDTLAQNIQNQLDTKGSKMTTYNSYALRVNLRRPTEDQVSEKVDSITDQINAFSKSGTFSSKDPMEAKHQATRILVKKLFTECKTQGDINIVIRWAKACTKAYDRIFPDGDESKCKVHFELRIADAVRQVSEMISKGINPAQFDPKTNIVILQKGSSKMSIESFGHMAYYLMRGYEVVGK